MIFLYKCISRYSFGGKFRIRVVRDTYHELCTSEMMSEYNQSPDLGRAIQTRVLSFNGLQEALDSSTMTNRAVLKRIASTL